MKRQDVILATLTLKPEHEYSPVQIQKLFFLMDELILNKKGGKLFDFTPYHYGPFDKSIYEDLDNLNLYDLVDIRMSKMNGFKVYSLTKSGVDKGNELLRLIDGDVKDDMFKLNEFVTSHGFAELVSAIYKAFPEMKVNSIFNS